MINEVSICDLDKCILCGADYTCAPTKHENINVYNCPKCGKWGVKEDYLSSFVEVLYHGIYRSKKYLIAEYLSELNKDLTDFYIFKSDEDIVELLASRCVFCKAIVEELPKTGAENKYNCSNCGLWGVSYSYLPAFQNKLSDCIIDKIKLSEEMIGEHKIGVYADKKHLIAGYLYEFNKGKTEPYMFMCDDDVEKSFNEEHIPKTSMERLNHFLVALYKIDDKIGQLFWVCKNSRANGIWVGNFTESMVIPQTYPISIAYARNGGEVKSMFESLESLGYMEHKENDRYSITPKGFERADQLISTNIDSKKVFVAMDYRESHILEAYKNAIYPACEACGFNAIIIKNKPHNNGITDEIITEIKRSKFVIVDFTFNNLGAYWEAGFAQGLERPIIRCCKEDWFEKHGLHFDVKHYRVEIWENHEHLVDLLKSNIRANIDGAILEDPL
jgi:nucleoside 2-deoxyribosyltransferase